MALLENIVSSSENSIQEGTGGAIRVLEEAVEEGSPQVQRACHQNPPPSWNLESLEYSSKAVNSSAGLLRLRLDNKLTIKA
ncbi:hypothetical protein CXB51_024491 [Gossypium anomalum]|uniref:Uncharacterized protein n=1 Tax=Gossypium anomalum TaxID=47600 RepID=A0A8J5YUP7_9ROSI|nr:hypothetical protein CXB51_024491 [Gossypium anomalum]